MAAGNVFDQNSGGLDFEMTTEYLPVIKYYYDDGVGDQEPQYYTVVTSVREVDPEDLTDEDNACDVNPYEGGGSSSSMMQGLSESRQAYESLREEYDGLIDGGDTQALIAQINGTWHQEVADLHGQLLAISPFVSTEALKVLIDQPAIPDSVKLEVCAANPDATSTGGFMQWAEADAFQAMDVADMAEIAATWNTTTARTTMEQQLAQRHSALTRSVHHLLHHLRTDTAAAPDSPRWAWQQLRTNAARYAEASLLISAADHTEALAVVQAMPQECTLSAHEEAERGRMVTYISVLQSAANDERDAYHLNGGEVQQLVTMVGDHYDRPAVWASNLLCAAYDHCRPPYTGGSGGDPKQFILPEQETALLPVSSALNCTEFEGKEVDWIFRVNVDGTPDTTFRTGVHLGSAYSYLPLVDGRVYVGGRFYRSEAPSDTLTLVRFMPDGSLDPTFAIPHIVYGQPGWSGGVGVSNIQPWMDGSILITGQFKHVNGQPRRGICLLDSTGQVLDAFHDQGVGVYNDQQSGLPHASIAHTLYDTANAHLYICGAYVGYNDGTINDPTQRFVSRLLVEEDTSTGVEEAAAPKQLALRLHPNPANGWVQMSYHLPGNTSTAQVVVRDVQGSELQFNVSGTRGQHAWDMQGVAPGVYMVELRYEGRVEHTERLVIQP